VTGLEHVAIASKPLVRDFSNWLPQFGNELGGVFDEMGRHSKEAEQGLHILEDGISGLTNAVAGSIPVFSKLFDALQYISTYGETVKIGELFGVPEAATHGSGVKQFGDTAVDAFTRAYNAGKLYNGTLGVTIGYYDQMNRDLASAAANFDRVFGITLNSQQANLQLAQSITSLSDSLAENGRHWDITTAAGQANRARPG
jgi:hypothetical protein